MTLSEVPAARRLAPWVALSVAIVAAAAIILRLMGHPWICTCGYVKLWHGETVSSENSQHLIDWYTTSHLLHGIVFYFILWLVARQWPHRVRFTIALAIEAAWEILENTPWIINRYREATISLDYYGDSVLNSVTDILAMVVGWFIARHAPVWVSVVLFISIEAALAFAIRDNLTLNILMLIYPIDAVRIWQGGG
jgi:hypothetical protein